MTTLEKCMKTTATTTDLKEFNDIVKGLKLFRKQYEFITWFNNDLDYKEYSTLEQDFSCFCFAIPYNKNQYELSILQSLHRSFQILHNKLLKIQPTQETLFKAFIHSCTIRLRNIINEVTEPTLHLQS